MSYKRDKSFTCEYTVFPATFVEKVVFSPSCVLGFFVEDPIGYSCVGLCLGLLFHWSLDLFLCQFHAVFIAMALSVA
jgi:hypothetical protein